MITIKRRSFCYKTSSSISVVFGARIILCSPRRKIEQLFFVATEYISFTKLVSSCRLFNGNLVIRIIGSLCEKLSFNFDTCEESCIETFFMCRGCSETYCFNCNLSSRSPCFVFSCQINYKQVQMYKNIYSIIFDKKVNNY